MLTVTQEKPNQFSVKSTEEISVKQTKMEKGTNESVIFLYGKGNGREDAIGIIKASRSKENIEFKLLQTKEKDGILIETNKPVAFETIQNTDKTLVYISES